MASGSRTTRAKRLVTLALFASLVSQAVPISAQSAATREHYFTHDQSSAGRNLYSKSCAECHGSDLQGKAGPALSGKKFGDSLDYSKMSASQLFDFISKQMPANNPGSLSRNAYVEIFSYLLCANGFTPGDKALDSQTIKDLALTPLPDSSGQQCS